MRWISFFFKTDKFRKIKNNMRACRIKFNKNTDFKLNKLAIFTIP